MVGLGDHAVSIVFGNGNFRENFTCLGVTVLFELEADSRP